VNAINSLNSANGMKRDIVNLRAYDPHKVVSIAVPIHMHVDVRLMIQIFDNRAARSARWQMLEETFA
jgi:hypothetical protein